MQEARRAQFGAVGFVGTIGDQVDTEFALGGLYRGINLALWNVEAFGVQLEVMDQALHRGLHVRPAWRRDLTARQNITWALADFGDGLTDDQQRLAHLFHTHQIAVVAVAVLAYGDLKFELVIAFIGLCTAQIPGQARPAHHDAREAVFLNVIFGHDANVSVALFEDAVFGQ